MTIPGDVQTMTPRPVAAPERPVSSGRRRRRPTGAPPALPRQLGITGKLWLTALGVLLVWAIVSLMSTPSLRVTDRVDTALLRWIATLRTGWLTSIARTVVRLGEGWTLSVVILGVLVALMVFRRWRHLLTFLGSLAVLHAASDGLYDSFARPRPYGVTTIGPWAGYSLPSSPVVVVAAVLIGIIYTLVVPGRPRTVGKYAIAPVLAAFAGARLYLGIDHPLDVVTGAALGVAIPLTAFRLLTPNTVFPVNYRRAKTAHLDVSGRRGEAIRKAIGDQLGILVDEVEPIGLEASGGSTPLRMRVVGDPGGNGPADPYLFGKLYAMSHVRADRWYKLGRTILYGRLEDETPYKSVQRLVEYEDYALRLLRDVGIPTANAYGIVEITPSREYLLVTSFLDGGVEIGRAEVDDDIIDQSLMIVRRLWDSGLAHRDIKPANLLVRDGNVYLIDPAFMQVRPSPWREAVDLANMMLVLAVRTDAERVYERALRLFTPDEIAEAFAAARGIASPTQLRSLLRRDGRDLVARFRALAPPRKPIALQRWGLYRFGMAFIAMLVVALAVTSTSGLVQPAGDTPVSGEPSCGTGPLMILAAQAVPESTHLPCVASLPTGWHLGETHVRRGQARFWLGSDVAGERAVEVTLQPADDCDLTGASEEATDEAEARLFQRVDRLAGPLLTTRFYLMEGGCVTYRYRFVGSDEPRLLFEADEALALMSRHDLVEAVERGRQLSLCGAGALPCPGGTGD